MSRIESPPGEVTRPNLKHEAEVINKTAQGILRKFRVWRFVVGISSRLTTTDVSHETAFEDVLTALESLRDPKVVTDRLAFTSHCLATYIDANQLPTDKAHNFAARAAQLLILNNPPSTEKISTANDLVTQKTGEQLTELLQLTEAI